MKQQDMSRQRAVDEALEECLRALEAGATVEWCLARYPGLEGPLRAAADLQAALEAEPRPERTTATRARVLAAASAGRSRPLTPRSRWRRAARFFTPVAAGFLAAVVMLTVTVSASAHALPGDALYPIKRATERVRYVLTFDDGHQASLHVQYAERRLAEIRRLGEAGKTIPASVLESLSDELAAAADARAAGRFDRMDAAQLEAIAAMVTETLEGLGGRLPAEAAGRALEAARTAAGSAGGAPPDMNGSSEGGPADRPPSHGGEPPDVPGHPPGPPGTVGPPDKRPGGAAPPFATPVPTTYPPGDRPQPPGAPPADARGEPLPDGEQPAPLSDGGRLPR